MCAAALADRFDVMISYQWDSQARMKKLKDRLSGAGLSVWMDLERMAGNMNDRMAEAVEKSDVIVVCVSKPYQGSWNCKKEANYADHHKKRIIPLKYDDHRPSGWLGLLVASLLYYDVSTDQALDDNFDDLLNDIKNKPKPSAAQDATYAPPATTRTSKTDPGQQKISDKDILQITKKAGLGKDDLQMVFVELDLNAPEIERAEGVANTKDYQLQGLKVLQSWRKKIGKEATRIVIINALEECGLKEATDYLKEQWKLSGC